MDGTRDRPPGKSAENWSRKDGIRAGSVSGPWRSGPREAGPGVGRLPGATAGGHAPQLRHASAAADPLAQFRHEPIIEETRGRRRLAMGIWIGFGVLVAVGIVVAAFLFRPSRGAGASRRRARGRGGARRRRWPRGAVAPVAAAAPAAEPAVAPRAPSDPALAGVSTVRLRIGPDFPPDRQAAILKALSDDGIPAVRVEPLPFKIATSRVGYYRAADLAAAEALGRLMTPVIGEGADIGVRDYSQLLADPEPGRLDLWVGG